MSTRSTWVSSESADSAANGSSAAYGRRLRPRKARREVAAGSWALVAAIVMVVGLFVTGATAAQTGRTIHLVALGDSLTAGYGLPAAAAFPTVLEQALRRDGRAVEIANAGVSGDTASGGLDRLDWSVPDGTDGVILELGANDMLRGTDPGVTARALDAIVSRLKARGIPVMLAGMYAARNLGPDYVARFDAIYPDLARTYGLILYPFFLDGVQRVAGRTQADGLHPTEAGVGIIVERIRPVVEDFLKTLDAKRPG